MRRFKWMLQNFVKSYEQDSLVVAVGAGVCGWHVKRCRAISKKIPAVVEEQKCRTRGVLLRPVMKVHPCERRVIY